MKKSLIFLMSCLLFIAGGAIASKVNVKIAMNYLHDATEDSMLDAFIQPGQSTFPKIPSHHALVMGTQPRNALLQKPLLTQPLIIPEPVVPVVKANAIPKPKPIAKKIVRNKIDKRIPKIKRVKKPSRPLTRDEKQLVASPEGSYTIELFKTTSLRAAKQFIKQHHLTRLAHFYCFQQKGKKQYSIVMKRFNSQEDALLSLSELPLDLQRWYPQVVSIKTIKQRLS